jgi:hypothetical protein
MLLAAVRATAWGKWGRSDAMGGRWHGTDRKETTSRRLREVTGWPEVDYDLGSIAEDGIGRRKDTRGPSPRGPYLIWIRHQPRRQSSFVDEDVFANWTPDPGGPRKRAGREKRASRAHPRSTAARRAAGFTDSRSTAPVPGYRPGCVGRRGRR